jgi:hypothetical protein
MSNFGSFDIDLEKDRYVLLIVIFDSNNKSNNSVQPPKSLFKVNPEFFGESVDHGRLG